MNKLEFFGILNTVFVGDVHGDFKELVFKINSRYKFFNSVFIVVGDFGMGFHSPNYYKIELEKLSKKLESHNNHLLIFRGNHDDPFYFKEINKFGNAITLITKFILNSFKQCYLYAFFNNLL